MRPDERMVDGDVKTTNDYTVTAEIHSHGMSGYGRGCRCEVCRAAKRAANLRYNQAHRDRLNANQRERDRQRREVRAADELYQSAQPGGEFTARDAAEAELRSHFDQKRGAELRELRSALDEARDLLRTRAAEAVEADWPVTWIAEAAGVSRQTIRTWVRGDEDD